MRIRSWLFAAMLACMQWPVMARAVDAASPGVPPALAASLPLLRDAAQDRQPGAWASSALLLALTAAAGGWFAWRRWGRKGPGREAGGRQGIVRLHSQALTPQASVHAVLWNGEELLVGCTPQGVTLLARSKPQPEGEGEA